MEPECYQLKWHSFEAHMQACVATLLHSETFADVVLSTADGRHISGHRFVLAASSNYLQRLLGAGSLVAHNHLPVVVIMPPEVTYHALCVLIKYMYSGEATVPNSQLGAVLRAGDILKVRGLWRPSQHSSSSGRGDGRPERSERSERPERPHHLVQAMQSYMRRSAAAAAAAAAAAGVAAPPAAHREEYVSGLGVHRHFMDPAAVGVGTATGALDLAADRVERAERAQAARQVGRPVGHEDPADALPPPRSRGLGRPAGRPGRPPLHGHAQTQGSRLASRRGVRDYRDCKDELKTRRREARRRERIHLAARAAAAAATATPAAPVATPIVAPIASPGLPATNGLPAGAPDDDYPGPQPAVEAAVADQDGDVNVEGAEQRAAPRGSDGRGDVTTTTGTTSEAVEADAEPGAEPDTGQPLSCRREVDDNGSDPDLSALTERARKAVHEDPREKDDDSSDLADTKTILEGMDALANLVVGEMRIKEEPIEWDMESEVREALMDDVPAELRVKPEAPEVGQAGPGQGDDELLFSPLSCEICQVTFYSPAEWVRHAESEHGELRRRPRRRTPKGRQSSHDSDRSARSAVSASTSSERANADTPGMPATPGSAGRPGSASMSGSCSGSVSGPATPVSVGSGASASAATTADGRSQYAQLVCDICNETFSSPALWARHLQTSHTDEELAMHNRQSRPVMRPSARAMSRGPPNRVLGTPRVYGPGQLRGERGDRGDRGSNSHHGSHSLSHGHLGAGSSSSGHQPSGSGGHHKPLKSFSSLRRVLRHREYELAYGLADEPEDMLGALGTLEALQFDSLPRPKPRPRPRVRSRGSRPSATLKRCGMCTKAFLSKTSLQIHRRTHTGERPFVCDACGYGFSVKSNLVRHIRTLHNGHAGLAEMTEDADADAEHPDLAATPDGDHPDME